MASKNQQQSQSTSLAGSQSVAGQQAGAGSFVAPFQVPFLQSLFGGAAGVAGQQAGQIGPAAQALGGQIQPGLMQLLGGLGQQAQATPAAGAINQLQQLQAGPVAELLGGIGQGAPAGQAALQGIVGAQAPNIAGGAPAVSFQPQIDALGADINQQLGRTLGTIGSAAGLAGGFGGSRQALASGLAGEGALDAFTRGAGALRGQESLAAAAQAAQTQQLQAQAQQQTGANALQAALGIQQGGLAQTGIQSQSLLGLLGQQFGGAQAAGQLGLGQQAGQLGAATAGIAGAPTAFNLGLAPFGAEFSPFSNLAGILGPAIINSLSQSSGFQQGSSFAESQSTSEGNAATLFPFGGDDGGGGGLLASLLGGAFGAATGGLGPAAGVGLGAFTNLIA